MRQYVFNCPKCDTEFREFAPLGYGELPEYEEFKDFKCDVCNNVFSGLKQLKDMKFIINEEPEELKPLCKNCEYWDNKTDEDNENFGSCLSGKMRYEPFEPCYDDVDILIYSDYECYDASVETGKNFGCVHFERKGSGE